MWSIYIKYLNQTSKIYKKRNEIYICRLELEQKLYITNKKREKADFFL